MTETVVVSARIDPAANSEAATVGADDMRLPLSNAFRLPLQRVVTEQAPQAPVKPSMDADTEQAARAFMRRLEGKYPVIEGILFGSRARGNHSAESDADIAVVLSGTLGDRTVVVLDMAGIAFDVMLETGVLVEALPLSADEIQRPKSFSNPALIENIRRDGVRL